MLLTPNFLLAMKIQKHNNTEIKIKAKNMQEYGIHEKRR
jgi:hypothetical protein